MKFRRVRHLSTIGLTSLILSGISMLSSEAAAEKLTRREAIARALAQNPKIAAARSQVTQSQARGAQVSAARLPSINVVVGAGPSLQADLVPGTAIQSTRNAYGDVRLEDLSVVLGGTLSIVQPLYTFGKIDHRADAAAHEAKAREHQAEMTKAEIAFEVAKLYESVLFARDAGRFFQEMLHGLSGTIAKTEEEVAAGRMTEGDLLRIQTAVGFLKLGKHKSDAGLVQATAGLAAYLALPPGADVEPAENNLVQLKIKQLDEARLNAIAKRERPEIGALAEGQAAYGSLADAEGAGNLPDFFATVFASGAYTPGRDLIDTRFAIDPLNHFVPGALVGARWQFNGGMADERASENRAKAAELAHMERWANDGIPAEVRVALEELRRAQLDIDSTDIAVKRAKKWAVQAAADFSFGLGASSEVEDSTSTYVQLRLALLRARYEYNVGLASLAKATGTLAAMSGDVYPPRAIEPRE